MGGSIMVDKIWLHVCVVRRVPCMVGELYLIKLLDKLKKIRREKWVKYR